MLDISYYRFAEEKAKNNLPTWLISKKYSLEVFEKEGFPTRLSNIQQLKQIFNTMQEDRFDIYMRELGGFNDEDLSIFLEALKKSIDFQRIYFPTKSLILPLDTLMAFFVIYHKIHKLNPKARTIFEIGPGSGFFAFFLNRFQSLQNYTYTDACESFYMLQNYINFFVFGDNFIQHAIEDEEDNTYFGDEVLSYNQHGIERDLFVTYDKKDKRTINAYPWWRLNQIATNEVQYDIVTSNANLLEFSEGALNDYLSLIKKKISTDGLFFVHCPGYDLDRSFEYLIDKLYDYKFALVFYAKWTHKYECKETSETIEKRFKVPNLVLVSEGHELYEKYKEKRSLESLLLLSDESFIDDVFLPNKDYYKDRKIYSKNDIKEMLLKDDNFKD